MIRYSLILLVALVPQDLGKVLERADKLLEEAKAAYEDARSKSSVAGFVDAGFKLEEARIKYLVLQEIGSTELQKTAAERLRAVNQLTKLVHDGKVAISGAPAEVPKPVDPAAPKAPDAPPPPPPAGDVTKRLPVPDVVKQKETEKQVRDLFKEDYAKKAPADRKALARQLLEQASQNPSDPVAAWVLCREAHDIAVQVADVDLATASLDFTAGVFDVDLLAMKTAMLAALVKTARTTDEHYALAEAHARHVDDLILVDQYETADKAAAAAAQLAKKAGDEGFSARIAVRSKEVAEAKTLYQAQKRVLETLAKNPEDAAANLEMGKFLCYVKGQWDLGLRFLVKGSDPALKALAEKEVAAPIQSTDRVALADGWFDLGEKDKSPLRKSQLLLHAKGIYESALADASSLVKLRIEKRLDSLKGTGAPGSGPIDLLRLIDVKRDAVAGDWTLANRVLTLVTPIRYARLQAPYEPPEEFDVTVIAERKEGAHVLYVGLARGSTQFYVALDDWRQTVSGLGWLDGKTTKDNETAVSGKVFTNNKPCTIVVAVRKDSIVVTVDGRKLISFKGEFSRFSNVDVLTMPNPRVLWIGATEAKFVVTKFSVTPLSGPGKVLR